MKKQKYLLLLLIAGSTLMTSSCKKKSTDEPTPAPVVTPPGGAPALTSTLYFQAKIDGTWVTFQEGVSGYASGAASEGGTVPAGYQEDQVALVLNYSLGQGASFFLLKTFPYSPDGTQVSSMFGVRSYTYGKTESSALPNGLDGAGITYTDASGTTWTTDNGTADQTGSTFSIVELVANEMGSIHKIAKANFSCKLYDASGHSKTLTDGVLRGRCAMY